jgi:hypothetical protein
VSAVHDCSRPCSISLFFQCQTYANIFVPLLICFLTGNTVNLIKEYCRVFCRAAYNIMKLLLWVGWNYTEWSKSLCEPVRTHFFIVNLRFQWHNWLKEDGCGGRTVTWQAHKSRAARVCVCVCVCVCVRAGIFLIVSCLQHLFLQSLRHFCVIPYKVLNLKFRKSLLTCSSESCTYIYLEKVG